MKRVAAVLLAILLLFASLPAFAWEGANLPSEISAYIEAHFATYEYSGSTFPLYDAVSACAEVEGTGYYFVLLHGTLKRISALAAFKKDAAGVYQFLWLNDTLFPVWSPSFLYAQYDDDQTPSLQLEVNYDDGDDGLEALNAVLTQDGWMVRGKPLDTLRAEDVLYYNPGPWIPMSEDGLSLSLKNVALDPNWVYDVYCGPSGTLYERAAQGTARLSTNDWVQVFGQDGDWLLVQYEVSEGQYRFGYIPYTALKAGETAESVDFASSQLVRAVRDTILTDDPLGKKAPIREIKEGMELRHLASIQNWFYVEVPAYSGQKAIRGFVPETAFLQKVTNMWYDEVHQLPSYTARVTYGVYFMDAVYENRLYAANTWQVVFTVQVTGQKAGDEPIKTYRLYNDAGELVNESPVSTIDPTPKINGTFFLDLALDGARPRLTLIPCYERTSEHQDEAITIQIQ